MFGDTGSNPGCSLDEFELPAAPPAGCVALWPHHERIPSCQQARFVPPVRFSKLLTDRKAAYRFARFLSDRCFVWRNHGS